MNILVAMKQIPDLQQVRIRDRRPIVDNVPLTFSKIDKNALEAAVQIKEADQGKVIAVCVGSQEVEDTVKEALAAGADEAKLVIVEGELESGYSARLIAGVIKQMDQADLIMFGEGSGDNYSSQVGSRVAHILGWPQVAYVSQIKIQGSSALLTRSLEDSEEIVEVQLPAVISVIGDLNEPRIPSVTQILKAGRKPKETFAASQLGVEKPEETLEIISNLAPEMKRKQINVKSVSELVQALSGEGLLRRD